ncbi:PTR2-domain-containing protein [Basidiobolus meristosporus CBS 931.73]|uniref:PTR2-domain-containing protein n=1 Tax=Basidiobolus meristosporus CBS 931.73 TaxID=1314790 RepID=A0A1Y1ZDE7_9FUNG|nr:PTR2-domain-containing protein [Basidiobolus meristosporus CBS 931.73]|eukprot:ORY08312.1 PTR2-domain-containing protein [Basidiobolus meristosporus CBS 931.73]
MSKKDINSNYASDELDKDAIDSCAHLEEDISKLRRVADRIPTAAWLIIVTEFCERFAYYGGSAPFTNYVQFPAGNPDQAGALDKGQATSNAWKQFFTFFCYFTPLFGAVISDQYLGKFKTILIFCSIYMIGWLILTLTAIPPSLAAGAGYPGYIVSLIVIGLGTGGIKPLVSPMAADQYTQKNLEVRVIKGERVVADPALNTQHLYNWFYWAINVGSLVGGIITPQLESHIGFWLAYLVPTVMFAMAISVFYLGRGRYVKVPPSRESTLLKAIKCFTYSRKRYSKAKVKPASILDAGLSTYEEASPETDSELASRTWDDQFITDLKQCLMACKIYIPITIYQVSYNQITSNLISQAADMNLPPHITDDLINNIDPIALIIFIPIMDTFVYPFLRRIRMNPRPMARITLGFIFGALAMMSSALVQNEIYRRQDLGLPKVSVWLQIPAYILIAISEIFASITAIEYSYTHAPDSLKGLVSAFSLLPNAAAALICIFLSPVSKDPYLTWNYASIAIVCFLFGIGFWLMFRHYDDLDDKLKEERVGEK